MDQRSLDEWLGYIESLHSSEIEFGLKRVKEVYSRLFPNGFSPTVVTVAGTNGKGTTCAYIESLLLELGYSCGKHTSPHLINFQERINVQGLQASDNLIVRAFEEVELKRAGTQLTYFEFTFLAALCVFEHEGVDFAVCEVGLGGRLDAVNILNPEVSVITMVGLDHTDWLGNDLGVIATEKAGIARENKPCIVGMESFPKQGLDYLKSIDSIIVQSGVDYHVNQNNQQGYWSVSSDIDIRFELEKLPNLFAEHLNDNAACALMAVHYLLETTSRNLNIKNGLAYRALASTSVVGRCQIVEKSPLLILDVAHNEDSVNALNSFVGQQDIEGKTVAVFSMLVDKDISSSLSLLSQKVDIWHIAKLDTPRGMPLDSVRRAIAQINQDAVIIESDCIKEAFYKARKTLSSEDCLLVFGSFWVVGDILPILQLT